jgi:beta-glucosidase
MDRTGRDRGPNETVETGTVARTPLRSRVDALLRELTLEEKASLTVGRDLWTTRPVERLGIPSVWLADGPTGLRKVASSNEVGLGSSVPATCFPTESALAASWDVALVREVGRAIGAEAQAHGVQVLLAPGLNLKRSPLGGRSFEYFSEDPVLSGELAAAFIAGVQGEGVGTSVKHFVANESETQRMSSDSIVDERTLRELYLRPFEIAVARASPWTVMAAYNRLNGTFCTEHTRLLHDVLKEEWGYRGIVVSDWLAVNDRVAGIAAGLHLQMPGAPTAASVAAAVREGRLEEARLDEVVRELLMFVLEADARRRPGDGFDPEAHHRLARRVAADCIVLLRNEGGVLPLEGDRLREVALIGAFARTPRFQGAGSSEVVPTRVDNAHDELARLIASAGSVSYAAGYREDGETDRRLLEEAQAIARQASVAVVFVGLPPDFEAEGSDRSRLDLSDGHNGLVEAVLEVQPDLVVVLSNGAPVTMPWVERVPAVVEGWLGGQAGGGAVADVLLGRVNPSARLPETFPLRLADTPGYLGFPHDGQGRVVFGEGVFMGYRWYDAREIEPLFPFGHGLSYTTFAYSDLTLDRAVLEPGGTLEVSVTVRNTGERPGREVVQLYVHERQPRLARPVRELKAFAKVWLEPGEAEPVVFQLNELDFGVFDPQAGRWVATGGSFEVLVGASSRDIRVGATVKLEGTPIAPPLDRFSVVGQWLAHPVGRQLVEPLIAPPAEPSRYPDWVLRDLPISKLVLLGVIDEDELERMLSIANGRDGSV